jgi:hypothetical protein
MRVRGALLLVTKPRRSIATDVTGKQDASHRHAYIVCASLFSDATIHTTQTLNLLTPDSGWVCGLWTASYWRLGLLLLRLLRISSSTYCNPVICGRQNNIGGTLITLLLRSIADARSQQFVLKLCLVDQMRHRNMMGNNAATEFGKYSSIGSLHIDDCVPSRP